MGGTSSKNEPPSKKARTDTGTDKGNISGSTTIVPETTLRRSTRQRRPTHKSDEKEREEKVQEPKEKKMSKKKKKKTPRKRKRKEMPKTEMPTTVLGLSLEEREKFTGSLPKIVNSTAKSY